jgi:hypothetical protein
VFPCIRFVFALPFLCYDLASPCIRYVVATQGSRLSQGVRHVQVPWEQGDELGRGNPRRMQSEDWE